MFPVLYWLSKIWPPHSPYWGHQDKRVCQCPPSTKKYIISTIKMIIDNPSFLKSASHRLCPLWFIKSYTTSLNRNFITIVMFIFYWRKCPECYHRVTCNAVISVIERYVNTIIPVRREDTLPSWGNMARVKRHAPITHLICRVMCKLYFLS